MGCSSSNQKSQGLQGPTMRKKGDATPHSSPIDPVDKNAITFSSETIQSFNRVARCEAQFNEPDFVEHPSIGSLASAIVATTTELGKIRCDGYIVSQFRMQIRDITDMLNWLIGSGVKNDFPSMLNTLESTLISCAEDISAFVSNPAAFQLYHARNLRDIFRKHETQLTDSLTEVLQGVAVAPCTQLLFDMHRRHIAFTKKLDEIDRRSADLSSAFHKIHDIPETLCTTPAQTTPPPPLTKKTSSYRFADYADMGADDETILLDSETAKFAPDAVLTLQEAFPHLDNEEKSELLVEFANSLSDKEWDMVRGVHNPSNEELLEEGLTNARTNRICVLSRGKPRLVYEEVEKDKLVAFYLYAPTNKRLDDNKRYLLRLKDNGKEYKYSTPATARQEYRDKAKARAEKIGEDIASVTIAEVEALTATPQSSPRKGDAGNANSPFGPRILRSGGSRQSMDSLRNSPNRNGTNSPPRDSANAPAPAPASPRFGQGLLRPTSKPKFDAVVTAVPSGDSVTDASHVVSTHPPVSSASTSDDSLEATHQSKAYGQSLLRPSSHSVLDKTPPAPTNTAAAAANSSPFGPRILRSVGSKQNVSSQGTSPARSGSTTPTKESSQPQQQRQQQVSESGEQSNTDAAAPSSTTSNASSPFGQRILRSRPPAANTDNGLKSNSGNADNGLKSLTRTSSISRAAGTSAVNGNSSSTAAATGGGGSALTVEEQQSIKGKAIVKLVDGQKDLTVDAVVRLLGRAVFKSENSFVDMREKVTLSIEALYSVSLFIGSSSTRQKKLGEQEKVFQHVVKLFDTFQDTLTICENAANALTTLCRCGKGPDKFSAVNVESCGTAGACELLVMTVKKYLAESCGPASVDFTAKGCALISYLSESSAKNRKKLVDAGACQVVADALDGLGRSDATVAQKALAAVAGLAKSDDSTAFADAGLCDSTIAILRSFGDANIDVVKSALCAVLSLAKNNSVDRSKLVASDVCAYILSVLRAHALNDNHTMKHSMVAVYGCRLIGVLAADSESRDTLKGLGAVDLINSIAKCYGEANLDIFMESSSALQRLEGADGIDASVEVDEIQLEVPGDDCEDSLHPELESAPNSPTRPLVPSYPFTILTTRFSDRSHAQNMDFRQSKGLACVYGAACPLPQDISDGTPLIVIEINVGTRRIQGFGGFIKQAPQESNPDWAIHSGELSVLNQNVYYSNHSNFYVARASLNAEEERIVSILENWLCRGSYHALRGNGLTRIPMKLRWYMREQDNVDIATAVANIVRPRGSAAVLREFGL